MEFSSRKAERRNYYTEAKRWVKTVLYRRADSKPGEGSEDTHSTSQYDTTGRFLPSDLFPKLEPILSESLVLNPTPSESDHPERIQSQSILCGPIISEPSPIESSLLWPGPPRSMLDALSPRRRSYGQWLSDDGEYTRRNSIAAMSISRPTSPFSLAPHHTSENPIQGSGTHQNRFRRSSDPPRMRRNASRGSYRSQYSTYSMSSQISWEEMDRYEAILQAIDGLVTDHIKRLRRTFWKQIPKSTKLLNDRCRESLASFQQCITEYAVEDHEPLPEAEDNLRYKSFVILHSNLKGELISFSECSFSSEEMDSTYCDEFCKRIKAFKKTTATQFNCLSTSSCSYGSDNKVRI